MIKRSICTDTYREPVLGENQGRVQAKKALLSVSCYEWILPKDQPGWNRGSKPFVPEYGRRFIFMLESGIRR
jgi:hypothetical protein